MVLKDWKYKDRFDKFIIGVSCFSAGGWGYYFPVYVEKVMSHLGA